MKIKVSKKRFILILVLSIILLGVLGGVIVFSQKREEGRMSDEYKKLFSYCDEEGSSFLKSVKTCKLFLGGDFEDENGKRCLSLFLPIEDSTNRELIICEKPGKIHWENPYDDYSSYVPVVMNVTLVKSVLSSPKVEKIEMEVMEEEEADELLDIVNLPYTQHIFIWRKEVLDIRRKGYYITTWANEEYVPQGNLLVINSVKIIDLKESGKDKVLDLEAFVNGEKLMLSFIVNPELVKDRKLGEEYKLYLAIDGKGFFSEDFVLEQFQAIKDGVEDKFFIYTLSEK